jgi:hypothetical protein
VRLVDLDHALGDIAPLDSLVRNLQHGTLKGGDQQARVLY